MYEVMLYCRRIRLIVEVLIDRLIFVLAYRTKWVKEFVLSRICSSLMSRVCRFVVFFGRPAPGLVGTVSYLLNLRIVWRLQRREIFSCREILCWNMPISRRRITFFFTSIETVFLPITCVKSSILYRYFMRVWVTKKSRLLRRKYWNCDRKEEGGLYNYANGFFLSLVRCASMDDEVHQCAQHITAH